MAAYYWVGGAGTWDATDTTHWATSIGGAGGAGVPTAADSAEFNILSNSGSYAVTIGTNAVAADITISAPVTGTVTITMAATAVINCYGNWLNAATGVAFSGVFGAALNFLATSTGKTVTTNNVSLSAITPNFNSASGGWTLGSDFSSSGGFVVTSGTFATANFALAPSAFTSTGSLTRSVSLGSSSITVAAATCWNASATGMTFSAGTSTITCPTSTTSFAGGGLTYNTVSFTSLTLAVVTISGANTFATLTFTSRTTDGIGSIVCSGNQTVTGTLTVGAANTAVRRLWLRSSAIGTQRTFTVQTLAALSDVDFRDIVAAGASAASPWTGTRLGNCRNNSNITFGAGVTKYFRSVNGVSSTWSGVVWSTSSSATATPVVTDFPLAQDTCIIDDSGATANNGLRTGNTVTMDGNWNIGTLDLSGRTVAFNWTQQNFDPFIYGNVTLTTAMTMVTVTGSPTWTFCGQGATQTLDSPAGYVIRLSQINVDSPGWGLTLVRNTQLDLSPIALPNNTGSFLLTSGTLDISNKVLTCVQVNCGAGANTIAFGTTGNITTTLTIAGSVFIGSTTTTVTGTPLVIVSANTSATRTITPGAVTEANSISFRVSAGTGALTLTAGAYRDLDFTDGTNPTGYAGAVGNTSITIYGNLKTSTSGMTKTAGTGTWTFAGAVAGTRTITTNGILFDNLFGFNGGAGVIFQLQDNLTANVAGSGNNRAVTLTAGTLDLNDNILTTGYLSTSNTNTRAIAFGSFGKIVIGGVNTPVFAMTVGTGFTYSGTSRIEFTGAGASGETRTLSGPTTDGSVANALNMYFTTGADSIALGTANRTYGTLDFTGFAGNIAASAAPQIYGDLVLSLEPTFSVTGGVNAWVFLSSSAQIITTYGATIGNPVTFSGTGAWALQDALDIADNTLQLNSGNFDTNNFSVTSGAFSSSNTNTRTLTMSNTTWTLVGGGTSAWNCGDTTGLTVIATGSTIDMNSGIAKTFNSGFVAGGGRSWGTLNQGGVGDLSIAGDGNSFENLTNQDFSGDQVAPTTIFANALTVGEFNLNGTPSDQVIFDNQSRTITKTSGAVGPVYATIKNSNATGGAVFTAFPWAGNVDGGGNTGWLFSLPPDVGGGSGFFTFFEA